MHFNAIFQHLDVKFGAFFSFSFFTRSVPAYFSCQPAQQTMLSLRTSSLTAKTSFCILPRGEHNIGLEGKDTAMPLLHCRAALQARLPASPSCLAGQHRAPWSCTTQQHDSIPCVQAAQGNTAEMHSAHCTQPLLPQPKLPHTAPCN